MLLRLPRRCRSHAEIQFQLDIPIKIIILFVFQVLYIQFCVFFKKNLKIIILIYFLVSVVKFYTIRDKKNVWSFLIVKSILKNDYIYEISERDLRLILLAFWEVAGI